MPRPRSRNILIAYDVSTLTKEGRRRLRRVAIACSGHGQRVQNSVFECRLTDTQLEQLEARLLDLIDPDEDRLRMYELPQDYARAVRIHGRKPEYDVRESIII